MFLLAHLLFIFLPKLKISDSPNYRFIFSWILIGIGYWIYATALWPSVAYAVKKKIVASAYGIAIWIASLGAGLGTLFVTLVHDHTINYLNGYFAVNVLYSF